jgi:Chaperone of endosialidase
MRLRARLLSSTMWSGFVGGLLLAAGPAAAADIVVKAPQYEAFAPAVDGSNGKIEGFGGSFANKTIYGAKGAFSVPLGIQFGLQIDGAAGSFDDRGFGSIGGHLFWRNPAQGLIGIYANHTHWDRFGGVHVTQIAGEGELYVGRWSLQGIAGVEFGNRANQITTTSTTDVTLATTTTTLTEFYDLKTQFFDKINLSYYPLDNWKVFVGHRYLGGKHAAALGTEWALPLGGGTLASLYVEGRAGEDDFRGVWGGLKFYFGQRDKSLIQRHRQDDPIEWTPESLFSIVNSFGRTSTSSTTCLPGEIFVVGVGCTSIAPSDVRLKRDVALLARLDNGIGLYRYRYHWSDTVYVGVMAQEVAAIVPDAVVQGADGYLRVIYQRLGLRLLTWDEWVETAPALLAA